MHGLLNPVVAFWGHQIWGVPCRGGTPLDSGLCLNPCSPYQPPSSLLSQIVTCWCLRPFFWHVSNFQFILGFSCED